MSKHNKPKSIPLWFNRGTIRKWASLESQTHEAILQTRGPNDSESDAPFTLRIVDKLKVADVYEEAFHDYNEMAIAALWWLVKKHPQTKPSQRTKKKAKKKGPQTLNEMVAGGTDHKMMSEFDKEDWDAYSKAFD